MWLSGVFVRASFVSSLRDANVIATAGEALQLSAQFAGLSLLPRLLVGLQGNQILGLINVGNRVVPSFSCDLSGLVRCKNEELRKSGLHPSAPSRGV